jgi:hypothetical protein
MVGINEELEAAEAAMAALSAINPNSQAMIRMLREAKYVAALAMTTLPSDKPLNDARHAVVITLSELVQALETDPIPQLEKIDTAKGAIRSLESALKARQELRLRRLAEGDENAATIRCSGAAPA